MANIYLDLDVPVGNGVGAFSSTFDMGRQKTITVQEPFTGVITIESSLDNGASWSTVASFAAPGKQVFDTVAQLMRVRRVGASAAYPGAPEAIISANDNGALFVSLPDDGTPQDVSALGQFKTISVQGLTKGVIAIDISDDGMEWTPCLTFTEPGTKNKEFTAKYMRARGATATIAVGAANDPISETGDTDELVKVSGDDDAAGYLEDKVVAGNNVVLDVLNPGAAEQLRIGTIGSTINGGALSRWAYKNDIVSTTTSAVWVDALGGAKAVVPADGDYWACFEGVGFNSSASGNLEIGIDVNSSLVPAAQSDRNSQGNASDQRTVVTSVHLLGLTAGDQIGGLFRKASGAGSVSMRNRRLTIIKVQ